MSKTPAMFNERSTALAVPTSGADVLQTLLGGGMSVPRLSIRGGVFRKVVGGQEVGALDARNISLVVVSAAPISRMYYDKVFKEGETVPPACWSADGRAPAVDVPASSRQAASCAQCPQNVKGSGNEDSRACRFNQRLAVMLTSDLENGESQVYQLVVPAKSIFGDGKDGKPGLQAYARLLSSHRADITTIATDVRLDRDSSTPRLIFSAERHLTPEEQEMVNAMRTHEDTISAISLTVAQIDGVAAQPQDAVEEEQEEEEEAPVPEAGGLFSKPAPEPKKAGKTKNAVKDEPVAPPTVRKTQKAAVTEPETEEDEDLRNLVAGWIDEDDD